MPRCFRSVHQRRRRLIHILAALRQVLRQVAVVVPIAMIKLDEAHAALGQPPRQQAVRRERARLLRIVAVELERARGSFEMSVSSGTEACIRNAISYCAMRALISGSPNSSERHLIQLAQRVEKVAPVLFARSPAGSTGTAPDRRPTGTSRPGTGSAETRCPRAGRKAAGRRPIGRDHHARTPADPRVSRAESVGNPRAHAGPPAQPEAGLRTWSRPGS